MNGFFLVKSRVGSMPIVLVLAMISILMVSVLGNYRTGQSHRNLLKRAELEFQAKNMAASALQHAELKIRYFPTELYDASEYSQGRNPFFDFSEISTTEYNNLAAIRKSEYKPSPTDPSNYYIHIAGPFNSGPRFLTEGTLSTDNGVKWFSLVGLDPLDSQPSNFSSKASLWFPTGWPKIDGQDVPNSDLYLWKFLSDISTIASVQPALTCNRDPAFDIAVLNSLPYEAGYEVKSIQVVAVKEHRRLNEEAIKISAVGWAKDPSFPYEVMYMTMDKTLKVTRR